MKYALGSESYKAMGGILPAEILGWDKSAEAVTAKYAGGGGADAAAVSDSADCGRPGQGDRGEH